MTSHTRGDRVVCSAHPEWGEGLVLQVEHGFAGAEVFVQFVGVGFLWMRPDAVVMSLPADIGERWFDSAEARYDDLDGPI